MSWNYRVMRDKDGYLSINEVYYDGRGKAELYTGRTFSGGETKKELKKDLKQMKKAFDKPILDEW